MRIAVISFIFATLAGAADVAQAGSGTATVSGDAISGASDQALTDAYKQALKNAGADDATIGDLEKGGAFTRAIRQLRRAKPPARADTFPFFTKTEGGVKKWAITLLPGTFANDDQKKVTEAHEEGHRQIDAAAVDALNGAAKAGKLPKDAGGQKLTDLLIAYENAANHKFHEVFGNSPKQTKEKLKEGDSKGLQEKAVKEAKEAGEKVLAEKLK